MRRPDFSEAEQKEILKILADEFQQDTLDQDVFQSRRAIALDDLFSPSRGVKSYPWPGASNITPPLIAKAVRTVWPRLVGALLSIEPIVQALAINPRDQLSADARAAYINYQVKNVIPAFKRQIATWLLDLCNGGSSILLTWFEQMDTWTADWMALDNFIPQVDFETGEVADVLRKSDREVLEELFGVEDLLAAVKRGEEYQVHFYDQDGIEKFGDVFIDRKDPDVRDDQLSVLVRKMLRVRRVRVEAERSENFLVPASASGFQREHAYHMIRKGWMHPEDIEEFRGPSDWHNLDTDIMQDIHSMGRMRLGTGRAGFDEELEEEAIDRLLGTEAVWGETGHKNGMVRYTEHYRPWKVNGKKFEMIFWVLPAFNHLAGWDYHTARFRHGRRPVTDAAFIPLMKRPHGAGLWHLISPYQEEAAVIFNQMNDRGTLRNNPILLAEQNAGIQPSAIRERQPGDVLTVRSVERVAPLIWGVEPLNDLPVLQQVYAFSEQMAGVGDISIGVQPNRPNAPRTARGTLALIGEGNVITDTHVMLLQEAFGELIYQIDGLNEQYISVDERFSITGKEEMILRPRDFRARVRFYFSGNTTNTNPQVQQAVAQFLLSNLVGHPIFTGAFLQLPEVALVTQWRLLDHFIRQHVPGKDSTFILPELNDLLQIYRQAKEAEAEQERILLQIQADQKDREEGRADLETQTKALKAASQAARDRREGRVSFLELIEGGQRAAG